MLGRDRVNRFDEVLRARIHRLSAGQDDIYTKACKNIRYPFARSYRNETVRRQLIRRHFRPVCLPQTLGRNVREQLRHRSSIHTCRQQLTMLLTHVQNVNLRNFSIAQSEIQNFTRRFRMNMYFNYFIVCDNND
ncbi:hypothetical protein D3C77_449990 [compost metagenome]